MTQSPHSRLRILDAAEQLFSERGYDAVTVRNITDTAGVRLGLLAYHFETKDRLFEAVISRRVAELNTRRLKALADCQQHSPPSIRALLEAFIRPYYELASSQDRGWQAYTKLIAQISHVEQHMPLLKRYLDPVGLQFIDAIQQYFCGCSRDQAVRGFILTAAAMVGVFARPSRIENLADGTLSGSDLHDLYASLVDFAEVGITAVCTPASRLWL